MGTVVLCRTSQLAQDLLDKLKGAFIHACGASMNQLGGYAAIWSVSDIKPEQLLQLGGSLMVIPQAQPLSTLASLASGTPGAGPTSEEIQKALERVTGNYVLLRDVELSLTERVWFKTAQFGPLRTMWQGLKRLTVRGLEVLGAATVLIIIIALWRA